MENIIEIKNLVKTFGNFKAVNNISLEIRAGEIFGILGPNGAGKTTTINMILGLMSPTSGSINIAGLDIATKGDEIKGLLGLMTQETIIETDLSAAENLRIFAKLYHVPKEQIEKRVMEALEEAELTEFAGKRAGTFSGGMKRRLALVQAMIQHPKVLVLDEPTTGVDIQNRINMWKHINSLSKSGVTIILTTQYLEEADQLCDRIAIINHGEIKAIGTASSLKKIVGTGRVMEMLFETEAQAVQAMELLLSRFNLSPSRKEERLTAILEKWDSRLLMDILSELDKSGVGAISVNVHLPTLDDVFVKLTGSELKTKPVTSEQPEKA